MHLPRARHWAARRAVALAAALVALTASSAANAQAHDTVALRSGRTFAVPADTFRLVPTPLVIMLPGWRQDDVEAARYTGLDERADLLTLTVAYGRGVKESFNAGACCGDAASRRVDDVTYLADVIEEAIRRYRVDPRRVYVMGFSNGGMMAYRIACERPDLVAAIAVVGGSLVTPCATTTPLRVLHVHGLADRTVPYAGGWSPYVRTRFPSMARVRTDLLARAPGSTIEHVKLPGTGHKWPTLAADGYDTTGEALDFFARFSR